MNIEEKNEGQKINYAVNKSTIVFDETISVNVARYQKDFENVIDVCIDNNMQLTTGLGKWYAANIIIPPRKYNMVDTGTKDDKENEIYDRVAEPLNMDDVTLVLWTLPVNYTALAGGAF
ncbi:AAA family ATPase [Clostridium chromiireducens]|uniref:AAA family ATPase n=1 Tax=Clostridium chromiireducens TaxID=225345 RepID=A0A399INY0_9CLOT|nr:AAA family ATPase [Clostridium chromiireducens]RII34297.1 AAA family ATPase [Clostridium chromiireducens]